VIEIFSTVEQLTLDLLNQIRKQRPLLKTWARGEDHYGFEVACWVWTDYGWHRGVLRTLVKTSSIQQQLENGFLICGDPERKRSSTRLVATVLDSFKLFQELVTATCTV